MIEVIIKYNGDISSVIENLGGTVDILSEDFAIAEIPENTELYNYTEIEYAELPRQLTYQLEQSSRSSCFYEPYFENAELDGNGIVIGIIDSGIDYSLPQFEGKVEAFINGGETDEQGHGTVTAGIITILAPSASLIIAKVGSGSRASSTQVMRAISRIIEIASPRPTIINISYGTNEGTHDGMSLFEQYIDEVSASERIAVIIASGNEGSASHHFSAMLSDNTVSMEINISGELTNLPLFISKSFADRITIGIKSPSGIELIRQGNSFRYNSTRINIEETQPSPYSLNTEIFIEFTGSPIENGIWTIELTPTQIIDGRINAWLPITEQSGSKTIFINPDPDISLTIPSAAYRAITVGGYNPTTLSAAAFSGRGFTALTDYVKPDIVAPAVNVRTFGLGGSISSYSGTSVAAPFVSAASALLMQWGIINGNDPILYGERLKAYLRLGASREKNISYPNSLWGYGRLCVSASLSILENSVRTQNNTISAYNSDTIDIIIEYSPTVAEQLNMFNIKFRRLSYSNEMIVSLPIDYLDELPMRSGLPLMLAPTDTELNEAISADRLQLPPIELSGRGVIIGIIDTGINYKNQEFFYDNGDSRIYSIWDMTIESNPPDGFDFGTQYTNSELSSLLAETTDELNHGTRLALAAAGASGVAPYSTIVGVKLRQANQLLRRLRAIPSDANAYSSIDFILGIEYILKIASELKQPVCIIIGMGTNEGGHNGQTRFERYISANCVRAGLFFSVAAGNEATAAHHTKVSLNSGYNEVEFRIAERESVVPIFIWNSLPSKLDIGIVSPLGEEIARLPSSNILSQEYTLNLTQTTVSINYYRPASGTTDQSTVVVFSSPASGLWKIRLYGNADTVHLWLPISGFIKEETVFLTPDSYTTATTPSTAIDCMCVGSFNPVTDAVYSASGRGPSRDGRNLPDIASPSFGNTSIAAAVCAGAAALIMEWGFTRGNNLTLNTPSVQAYLEGGAERNPNEIYPNNINGYGKLNVYRAFEDI